MPEAANYDYEKKVKNLPYRKFLTFFWKIFYYIFTLFQGII